MIILLFLATCFLAYANGANDNFKGVASLYGSRTCGYRLAIAWGTLTTFAGSTAAIFLATALLKAFSGKGLVPEHLVGAEPFLLAVAVGAGATVIIATVTGFPISTTHGLVGAITGAGLVAAGRDVNGAALLTRFLVPLLLSPVAAVVMAGILYVFLRAARIQLGVTKESCVCVGRPEPVGVAALPASRVAIEAAPAPGHGAVVVDEAAACAQRYVGRFLGVSLQKLMDAAHFLSAGLVSFARGLNDTPKIAALLLVAQAFDIRWGLVAVAAAMAIGGLVSARKVAETMGHRITEMNHGQGFTANLTTGLLVIGASKLGLPVSTTHVSVGSLAGIGLVNRQAHYGTLGSILASWFLTLPCAAVIAAGVYSSGAA